MPPIESENRQRVRQHDLADVWISAPGQQVVCGNPDDFQRRGDADAPLRGCAHTLLLELGEQSLEYRGLIAEVMVEGAFAGFGAGQDRVDAARVITMLGEQRARCGEDGGAGSGTALRLAASHLS